MAIEVGSAYVSIIPSFSQFGPAVQRELGDHGPRIGKQLGGDIGGGAIGAVKGLGTKLFAAAGIAAGFSFVSGLVDDARESAKVAAITENAIRSTGGAAKISASQVGDLATAISNKTGADDEAIQSGQNLLLTFTNVQNRVGAGNDVFNQASQTLVDMTAAMNQGNVSGDSMKATSVQLGKALNDPIKGITALSKVGVTFDDQQKKQIKTMVEAGNVAGAQKIILGELNKEFGGTAAAASNPMQKLGVTIGNIREQLGSYLLPIVDKFATWMSDRVIPGMSSLAEQYGPQVKAIMGGIGDAFKVAFDTAKPVAEALVGTVKNIIATFSGDGSAASPAWVKTLGDVKGIATDVFGALSDVGRLVGDVFKGAGGSGEFAKAWTGVKSAVSGVFDAIKGYYQTVIPIVRQVVDTVVTKFHELQPKIRPIITTVIDIVKSAFETIMVVVKTVTGVVSWIWQNFGADILSFITGAMDGVVAVLGGVFNVIKGVFDVVLGLLTGNWGRAWNGVKEIFTGVWDAVVGAIQFGWNIIMFAVNAIIDLFVGLWDILFGHSIIPDMVAGFQLAWAFIQAGWNLLVDAFSMLWNTVLKPVFDAIAAVAVWLWDNVLAVVFAGIQVAWSLLVAGLKWAWDNVLKPVWDALAAAANWLWNNVAKPVFAGIKVEWDFLVTALKWAWENVLKPVWDAIATVANWLWNNVAKPVFGGIKAAWDLLVNGIKAVWENVLKPVFDTVTSVVTSVADKVGKAFDGIGGFFSKAWSSAKDAVKDGWNAIANWVNSNVIAKVEGLFHITLPHLMTFAEGGAVTASGGGGGGHPARELAGGGAVFGRGTATSDSIPAMLSNGEFVLRASAVSAIGVDTLNRLNRTGKLVNLGPGGDAGGVHVGLRGYAEGGKVGDVKEWIRQQAGKPYVMNATGPGAWDCSGLVGAVWALLSGKNPYARHFSTINESAFFKPGLGGPHALNVGYFGGGGASGHTAGSLDGLNFEATPPHVLVGSTNYTPESGRFTGKGHLDVGGTQTVWGWLYDHTVGEVRQSLTESLKGLADHIPASGVMGDMLRGMTSTALNALTFDSGGLLPHGSWLVNHNGREPDRVLNDAQWKVAAAALDHAVAPSVEIHVHPRAEQSETEIAAVVSRELSWLMRGRG